MLCPMLMGNMSIRRMGSKKLGLALQSVVHRFLGHDIGLTPIYDANKSKLQRIYATGEDI